MTKDSSLGLVVVGYESGEEWEPFFRSLHNSLQVPGHIVIVDNSPQTTEKFGPPLWDQVQVLRLPDNPGYGSAVNAGVSVLPAEVTHVVISNPDIRFTPHTIGNLRDGLTTFPDTAITGPALENPDGSIYPSARAIPGLRIGIGHALWGNVWPSNPWTRRYLGDYRQTNRRPVGWVSGAIFMTNRRHFGKVGGFDERFFMFFEDVDLCYRLKKAGYRTVYIPDARALHEGGHSTRGRMAEMVRAHHSSAAIFLTSLYPHRYQAGLRIVLRAGLAIRSALQQAKYRRSENKFRTGLSS